MSLFLWECFDRKIVLKRSHDFLLAFCCSRSQSWMFCQNKFSKFTTINVSPFQTRRADFWLFLARIKEMFFLKTQVCKARSRTNHNKDNAHKFCQICLFNRTNCIECKLYTKLNINCFKWIIELNLKVLLLLAFLSWGQWAFC